MERPTCWIPSEGPVDSGGGGREREGLLSHYSRMFQVLDQWLGAEWSRENPNILQQISKKVTPVTLDHSL